MDYNHKSYLWIRSFIFLCIFELLHYSFELFPNIVVQIFSGINESNFQHWKIGYYSYLILTLVEFLIFRKKITGENREKFIYSHLLTALIVSWIIFIIWYIAPAIYGPIPILWIEIVYSIVACYISILIASILEQNLNEITFRLPLKIIIWILNLLLIMEFTLFTFNLPWADVFADPYL